MKLKLYSLYGCVFPYVPCCLCTVAVVTIVQLIFHSNYILDVKYYKSRCKKYYKAVPKTYENANIMAPIILIQLFQLGGDRVRFVEYAVLCCLVRY